MAIAFVQRTTGSIVNTTSGTASITGVTSGSLLVIGFLGTAAPTGFSDSAGTASAARSVSEVRPTCHAGLYYVPNAASGTHTFTVTFSSNRYAGLHIYEFSGADTSSPVDNAPAYKDMSPSSTTWTSSTLTPNSSNCLAFAHVVSDTSGTNSSWLNSYTESSSTMLNVGTRYSCAAYLILSGSSSTSTGCTYSTSATAGFGLFSFKEAAASSSAPRAQAHYRRRRR